MDWVWLLGLQPSWGRLFGSSGLNTTIVTVKSSANLPERSLQLITISRLYWSSLSLATYKKVWKKESIELAQKQTNQQRELSAAVTSPYPQEEVLLLDHLVFLLHGQVQPAAHYLASPRPNKIQLLYQLGISKYIIINLRFFLTIATLMSLNNFKVVKNNVEDVVVDVEGSDGNQISSQYI